MFYTVYQITNNVNGKRYVGAHQTNDLDDGYMGSGIAIRAAISKYGEESFTKTYVAIFDDLDSMFEMEASIVNEAWVSDENTYNLKEGGTGGDNSANITYDETHSAKISQAQKSKWESRSAMKRRKMTDRLTSNRGSFEGKHHTEETKRQIGKKNSAHQMGVKNSQYGTCWIYSEALQQNKKIPKSEIDRYTASGWTKGRKTFSAP